MKSQSLAATAVVAIVFSFQMVPLHASPVKSTFTSTVDFVDGSFTGLFAVGDTIKGTVRYDSANATLVMEQAFQKFYDLSGASLTVTINNVEFANYSNAPVRMLVRDSFYDNIDITFSTVPLNSSLVPLAPGPHGVTDLRFALQDNSGTALNSFLVPDANSAIWNAAVNRFDMMADPNGFGSNGIFNGMPDASVGSVIQSLAVGIPEPSTVALAAVGLIALVGVAVRRARRGAL